MTVRIIKSSKNTYWYNKHIGETFDVRKEGIRYFLERPHDGSGMVVTHFIEIGDCVDVSGYPIQGDSKLVFKFLK